MSNSSFLSNGTVYYEKALGMTIFFGPAGIGTVPLNSFVGILASFDAILLVFDTSAPVLCFCGFNF